MALEAFRLDYLSIPPVTRTYTTACVLTTVLVQLDLVSPFQLYFNPILITRNFQFWRLFTTFLFYGPLGLNFFFNLVFTYRYCKMLEEGSFRGKTADFILMFILGGVTMINIAVFASILFLGQAFTIMLVYIWARRNPYVRMSFFGLVNFQAPYLPFVLLAFSLLLGNSVLVDMIGIAVGHIYFFLEDIFPLLPNGFRILRTPYFLKALFDEVPHEEPYVPPDVRPGGWLWGNPNPPPGQE